MFELLHEPWFLSLLTYQEVNDCGSCEALGFSIVGGAYVECAACRGRGATGTGRIRVTKLGSAYAWWLRLGCPIPAI